MKKFFLTLVLFLILQTNCFAQNGISFLYINGANNNDEKMKNWYENGVKKLHPYMKKAFEQNEKAQKYFLKNGKYFIEEQPIIFFWGDKSHNELTFVENDLKLSKGFSPFFAYQIRSMLTHFLHDAIWVQKYHNMMPILEDLHKSVKAEAKKGNKLVLYGYSAGSFVTYEYLLTRLPYIKVKDFFDEVKIPQSQKDFVTQHPMKNTCMSALGKDLAVFSVSGHIIPNDDDDELFKKDYMNLNNLTNEICVPDNAVKGIVNFATPLVLFYSDLSDPSFQLTYYNRLLVKYIIENDMFWLTVNYREDPLGFPGGRNLSIEEIERIAKLDIEPHAGFIYDQSNTKGRTMVFTAHTSYWATRKNFSKAVARAYVNGYKHEYDDFKQNPLKKYEKKLQILP
jgi:hypothetical protein